MVWERSHRADDEVRPLADRHYNRQKVGAKQFVPPGRCLVLKARTDDGTIGAFWITPFPYARYVRHAWAGAMVCTAFRNERPDLWLSSDLIREAVQLSAREWPAPPEGLITFVDTNKTRHKRDPGRCFSRAGFAHVGYTKAGLVALRFPAALMR